MSEPWYAEGLRFECTQCGGCCTGAPGYVWVNQEEIEAIAAHLGEEDLDVFRAKYLKKHGARLSLKDVEERNYDCILLHPTERRCTIYAVRPRQCRTWPFWGSNVKSPEAWENTCEACPGSGKGQLYTLEQIEEQKQKIRI